MTELILSNKIPCKVIKNPLCSGLLENFKFRGINFYRIELDAF